MNMPKSRRTLYLSDEPFEQLQKLSPNVSQEVDGFIRKRVEELTSQSIGEGANYEGLKAKHSELVNKVARKDAQLKQKMPDHHEANELLAGLGLLKDFSNADELIPQFMVAWKGNVDFMQEYVTLVELARDKRQTERLLRTIRSGSKKEDPRLSPKDEQQHPSSEVNASQCRAIVPVV
jgi:hypothetical protein